MDEGAEGQAVGPGRCEVFDPDVLQKNSIFFFCIFRFFVARRHKKLRAR